MFVGSLKDSNTLTHTYSHTHAHTHTHIHTYEDASPVCTPPLWTKIFVISCSFLGNLYVGAFVWRVGTPCYGKSWTRLGMIQIISALVEKDVHIYIVQHKILIVCRSRREIYTLLFVMSLFASNCDKIVINSFLVQKPRLCTVFTISLGPR